MKPVAANWPKFSRVLIVSTLICLISPIPGWAQKNKGKKKDAASSAEPNLPALPPASDSDAIDKTIGEALGYWQIGEVESLHKYYSDDVVVISGLWEPPVIGWDNFAKAYQAQRAEVTGLRIDRANTVIRVMGNSAWATYQFVYNAMKDDKVVQFRGHTTVFLSKQSDRWVITLNHSSVVDSTIPSPAQAMQPGTPQGKP